MIQKLITKYFLSPLITKAYTRWYYQTRDWKKNDWRNWAAEEFDKIKLSKWTLRNFEYIKDASFDDLTKLPINSKYIEAPDDYPTLLKYYSTGTKEKKLIKLSKNDVKKVFLGMGRIIWTGKNEPKFKNGLYMGFIGLGSGTMVNFAMYLLSNKGIYINAGDWRKFRKKIIKNKPYDFLVLPLPYYADFLLNFKEDVYDNLSYWVVGGDKFTEYLRSLLVGKSQEIGKVFYSVDYYGVSECFLLGTEIPPFVTRAVQYTPETAIILLRKEDGELVNIFDAKPGDRGEILVTPLFEYTVPNYPIYDIIEIEDDESKFGLPTFRVLGREGIRVDIELESLGHIKGWYSIYARVMGINIDGSALNDLIGREFKSDSFCIVEQKDAKIYLRIYTNNMINYDDFITALKSDKNISYLYKDIENNLVNIEIIHNPDLIEELKKWCYEKYGPQASIPRLIILESETS